MDVVSSNNYVLFYSFLCTALVTAKLCDKKHFRKSHFLNTLTFLRKKKTFLIKSIMINNVYLEIRRKCKNNYVIYNV